MVRFIETTLIKISIGNDSSSGNIVRMKRSIYHQVWVHNVAEAKIDLYPNLAEPGVAS